MSLIVIAEAFTCDDTTDDMNTKPDDLQVRRLIAEHMQMVETQALRNIELAVKRTVQSSLRRAEHLQSDIGDSVPVRNFPMGLYGLPETSSHRLHLYSGVVGSNPLDLLMIVVESGGKQWRESVDHCKLYFLLNKHDRNERNLQKSER